MVIPVYNPSVENLERTFLSQGISAGTTALVVDNNNGIIQNDRIMVGEMGRERTEIVTVTGAVTAGTALTIGATTFPHEADEPVTKLRFDSVKYYRSTTGSTGTYTLISTVAMDVDNEALLTNYDDTTGLATYYYEVSYYHSVSTLESSLSDPIAGSGYSRSSVGFMIDEILREVTDEQEGFTSRTEILGWFNEVNDDLLTRTKKPYAFMHTRTVQTRTAGATTLAFPSDMWKFDRMDYRYTDTSNVVTTYPVRVKGLSEFRNSYGDSSGGNANNELQFIALDDTTDVFRLWPRSSTTLAGVFYTYYWKTFTQLDSEGDLFETPTPRVYKLHALSKYYRKKMASDSSMAALADRYSQDYQAEVAKLKRAEKKDAGSPQGFKFAPSSYKGNRRF